jgi:hypothetical protein
MSETAEVVPIRRPITAEAGETGRHPPEEDPLEADLPVTIAEELKERLKEIPRAAEGITDNRIRDSRLWNAQILNLESRIANLESSHHFLFDVPSVLR